MWVVALRLFPHSDQEGTQALEGTHSGLKGGVIRPAKRVIGRRVDWLCYTLLDDVIPDYERRSILRAAGYVSDHQQARQVSAAVSKARLVGACSVVAHASGTRVTVLSMSRAGHGHEVLQPATPWSTCSCEAGSRGQLCWHQVRAAFAVKGDSPDTLKLFASGMVGRAVRRPAGAGGNDQPEGVGPQPGFDPDQLRLDFEALLQGVSHKATQSVAAAVHPAAAAAGAAAGTAVSHSASVMPPDAGGGHLQEVLDATQQPPATSPQFVPPSDDKVSDVRLKPFHEQLSQRNRRKPAAAAASTAAAAAAHGVSAQPLTSTRKPKEKVSQNPLHRLQLAADQAQAATAATAAAAQQLVSTASDNAPSQPQSVAQQQQQQQQQPPAVHAAHTSLHVAALGALPVPPAGRGLGITQGAAVQQQVHAQQQLLLSLQAQQQPRAALPPAAVQQQILAQQQLLLHLQAQQQPRAALPPGAAQMTSQQQAQAIQQQQQQQR